ncbi:MAG: VacB/RNase II family 3'-5' exoribonuclease [Roseovarius sp.]|nr:VacB/RNase II family 3'-5' exoribonuclease [Roseovarius sp.]
MSDIPSKDEILQWILRNPAKATKRRIAKEFKVKGDGRIAMKNMLRELKRDGMLKKTRKRHHDPDRIPNICVMDIVKRNPDGELLAIPVAENLGTKQATLVIAGGTRTAISAGDRILFRLKHIGGAGNRYNANVIRHLGKGDIRKYGIYRKDDAGGHIDGTSKSWRSDCVKVSEQNSGDAKDGELVEYEIMRKRTFASRSEARVLSRVCDLSAPGSTSLIAIHQHGIPDAFPEDAIAELDNLDSFAECEREDLSMLPFAAIDPPDARDHDDAVHAHEDKDPENAGGHVIWVAIADVAHYVTPGSAMDAEARKRGNSSYFPDRVVPMLPERLSGDLCSLHEGRLRPCIAVRMRIDAHGRKIDQRFARGAMRSVASFDYREVQMAADGNPNEKCKPLEHDVIRPLYAAYKALRHARTLRQPLELNLPERKVMLDDTGQVASVDMTDRLDSHRLIEEFMVLANVAAAETLIRKNTPLIFRIHEEPSGEKLEGLRKLAKFADFSIGKNRPFKTRQINALLKTTADTAHAELVNIATLRAMTQACYSTENKGHFGLALNAYAHFTSPIRRYSDLIVHRALITAHKWGNDGLSKQDMELMTSTAELISTAERRSMKAERETSDRYIASYLSNRVGEEFTGIVSGLIKSGIFIRHVETGADGFVHFGELDFEYFELIDDITAVGTLTGTKYTLGEELQVRLNDVSPHTGAIDLTVLGSRREKGSKGNRRKRRNAQFENRQVRNTA